MSRLALILVLAQCLANCNLALSLDKEISNARNQQQIKFGEETEVDDKYDPKYRALAEESLQRYLRSTEQSYTLTSVDKVTRLALVAGTMTEIDFNAIAGSPEFHDVINCHSNIYEQPWTQLKQIDVKCKKVTLLPGGIKEMDPRLPLFQAFAEESLLSWSGQDESGQEYTLTSVDKATYQITAVDLYRIDFSATGPTNDNVIRCHSLVTDDIFNKRQTIDVNCHRRKQNLRRLIPVELNKQQEFIAGGWTPQDPSDPKYRALALLSLQEYNKVHHVDYTLKTVDSVFTQAVAGLSAKIDFTAYWGNRNTYNNLLICQAKILQESQEEPFKKMDVSCRHLLPLKTNRKDEKLNDEVEKDPKDPLYYELAEESLRIFEEESHTSDYTLLYVKKVTVQVVSGTLTKLVFYATHGYPMAVYECVSKVWEQPWLRKKDFDVVCNSIMQ